ncbi:MAG: ribosome-associated translation inhibitor RaiA [Bacilli bacterium]|nr:ribosome-associated translation inhibitor RaiA [Bacilli bacterium]
MKYQIIGKNIEVTDSIRAAVEEKLSRMDKYFVINEDVDCRVVVRSYKIGAKVEVTIFTKEMDFRTEVVDADLYVAVDFAIDKLEDQMRRLKTRMSRKGDLSLGKSIALEELEEEEMEEDAEEVVRTKSVYLKPMTLDTAVMKMEAIGHTFFLYYDIDDERVCVLYKRNDGGYGVLEAENHFKA